MSSSSYRHTESPVFEYDKSANERIHIPIHHASHKSTNPIHQLKDTTTQWIHDPVTGNEKYQMKINIEGFNRNEVNVQVDGNKLLLYGERIENKSQGTSKKIIEKAYNLPPDTDTFRPHVTFPSSGIIQIDFPPKHSSSRYSSPRKSMLYDIESSPDHRKIPIQKIPINSKDSSASSRTYKFSPSNDHPSLKKKSSTYDQQTTIETHRQRSSPITGLHSSYEIERHRSNSPGLSSITEEEDSVRSVTPHTDDDDDSSTSSTDSSIFPQDFNTKIFYESIFQPEIITGDRNQRYIEMKLDVNGYNRDDIKVSINDNDLSVQVDNTNFYKHITLPSNIDLSSLSTHYHHNKKLYITVKLLDAYSSFKYI